MKILLGEFNEEVQPMFKELRKGRIESSKVNELLQRYLEICSTRKSEIEEEFKEDIQRICYFQDCYKDVFNRKLKYLR